MEHARSNRPGKRGSAPVGMDSVEGAAPKSEQELQDNPQRGDAGATNVLCLIKASGERYIMLYEDRQSASAYRTLGKWAHDPELSFNWRDAAILSDRIRRQQTGETQ